MCNFSMNAVLFLRFACRPAAFSSLSWVVAPFLILDDSTSALDYLTEARLLKSIKEELSDTSLILVSQRTNSLKSADQILV